MAGGLIGPGSGTRRRYRPMAEINVTPLVDVMLVLLIVFMVTAPLITNAQDQIFLQNSQVQLSNLVATLQQIAQNDQDRRIFVRGDTAVSYGDMLQVMATITNGGFTKVALLAKQPDAAGQ